MLQAGASAARQFGRRRPLASTVIVGSTVAVGTACGVEAYTNAFANGELPREYDRKEIHEYWLRRPVTTASRLGSIGLELVPLALSYIGDFYVVPAWKKGLAVNVDENGTHDEESEHDRKELSRLHAKRLKESLTKLGPAFVKAGQQLSIRPDLVSPVVLAELQKLCDSVEPISDDVALDLIREELNAKDLSEIFADVRRVASASLGQVYRATLVDDPKQSVAVKVQRPDMRRCFSLDLFWLQTVGVAVDCFTSVFTNQPPFHAALYESFAKGSYQELDYEREANNQMTFRHELALRQSPVLVPAVLMQYTTQKVLTTEWVEGIKLADCPVAQIRKLIPVGVELFLTQLLDIGAFHADPHPGNLLVNEAGQLCLLDFGLCAEVDEKSRAAMTRAIVHLLLQDFETLISKDAIELGFLPENTDTTELQPLLTKILTVGVVEGGSSNLHNRKRKLMEISSELNEVFFRYPFSVPPFFALVTRGLGLLEGIALSGDPDFDIFRASAPFARRRAVALLGRHTWNRSKLSG
jgi:predicted unusual protein kinase regulating ubiquinone biosynthesis (AarF/ABC1/UbiB family)